jgi:hypothetical protein
VKPRDVGWIIGLGCALHAPSWFRPFMDIDEGSYAGIACRLLDGGTVYRDGVENKFPGIFYLYKAVFAVFGRYNMAAIHAAVTLAAIATALVIGAIARRYAAGDAAGDAAESAARWGAALYLVFSAAYYPKMLAGNTEMFAVLPAALTVWCYLRGRDRGWAWLVAAGAFGAATLLCKQVALATFAAVLADRALTPRGFPRAKEARSPYPALDPSPLVTGLREPLRALRDLALLAAGFAAVVIAMVLHLQHAGVWDEAVFWTWSYVLHYYMPSGTADHGFAFNLATSFLPFLITLSPMIYLAYRGRDRAQSALYWWLAGNVCASWVGGRMYGHYFLLFVPALAALAGIGAARWRGDAHRRERRWLIGLIAAIAIGFTGVATMFEGATGSAFTPSPDYREASAYVRARTAPVDQVFVWGWFPALYQAADRCPSTRFVYTHILSGANATGAERNHNVPEAWDMLMHDLEAAPPAYILDTSPGDYNFAFPPERYPRLWDFMTARYQPETTVAGVRMFRRR